MVIKYNNAMRNRNQITNRQPVTSIVEYRLGEQGAAIIETALVLPLLLLFLLGSVEYGLYFFKEQIAQRTVTSAANAIQQNLGAAAGSAKILDAAYNSGLGLVNYGSDGGYVCANAYVTKEGAVGGNCKGIWYIIPPYARNKTGLDYKIGNPAYYVKITAHVKYQSVTSLFSGYIPSGITVSSIVQVGANIANAQRVWRGYLRGKRNPGVVYKNTTSSEAIVSISMKDNNNGCVLYVGPSCPAKPTGFGSSDCVLVANRVDGGPAAGMVAGDVPPGDTYVVVNKLDGCYFKNWAELSTDPLSP